MDLFFFGMSTPVWCPGERRQHPRQETRADSFMRRAVAARLALSKAASFHSANIQRVQALRIVLTLGFALLGIVLKFLQALTIQLRNAGSLVCQVRIGK